MKNFFILILLMCFVSVDAQKQFINFSTDDGLVDMSSEVIFHDSYGYIWIGTYGGLSRYDGYEFRNYSIFDTINPLSSNTIFTITEDQNNTLWIGTSKALQYYNCEYDRFETLSDLSNVCVVDIAESKRDSVLWVSSYSGLWQVDSKTRKLLHQYTVKDGLPADVLNTAVCDRSGNVWIGTQEKGLCCFNPSTKKFELLPAGEIDDYHIGSDKINSLALDRNGNLWIGTADAGICYLDVNTRKIKHYLNFNDKNIGIGKNYVSDILIDYNNEVWICRNGYINLLNTEIDDFVRYNPPYGNELFSKIKSAYTISEDRYHNKWIGTHANGVFCQKIGQSNFKVYSGYLIDSVNSIKVENIRKILPYEDMLLMATDGYGLLKFYPKKNKIEQFHGTKMNSPLIMDIATNGDDLWCSTWGSGLWRVNLKNGSQRQMTLLDDAGRIIKCDDIRYVAIYDNIAWIGTSGEGLLMYDIAHERFLPRQISDDFNLKKTGWISCIHRDIKGRIWVSTFDGLFKYEKGKFEHIKHEVGNNKTISNDVIYSIFEDSNKNLWFTTNVGIDFYSQDLETFVNVKLEENTHINYRSIVEDDNNNLWISSNLGIYQLNIKNMVLKKYDRSCFILEGDFNINSAYKSRNGDIYFGGKKGFVTFNPSYFQVDTISPKISFSKLYINNCLQTIGSEYLPKSLDFVDTLIMNYSQQVVSIEISDLNHFQSTNATFSYEIEGLTIQPLMVDETRRISYSNIAPGSYNLVVNAKYANGQNSKRLLTIVVIPPWWATIWFRVLLCVASAVIIYLVVVMRLRIVRQQNEMLQKTIEEKTQELKITNQKLEQQNQQLKEDELLLQIKNDELANMVAAKDKLFSVIAHDLRNPISVIMGFSSHLNETNNFDERIRRQLASIYNSSKLINNQIETLLNWSRSQTGMLTCKPQNIHIESLVKDNITILNANIENKQINVSYKLDHVYDAYADWEMTNIVFRNILSNALKFTPRGGNVKITTSNTHDYTVFEIADTGVGMSREMTDNLFNVSVHKSSAGTENEKGTGLGLVMCREFLNINNAKIEVKSELGKGSTFTIFLPKGELAENYVSTEENEEISDESTEAMQATEVDDGDSKPVIMIVDDNIEIRNYIANIFSPYYVIETASNGCEGYTKALKIIPNMIITDIAMPIRNGFDMCRDIKANQLLNHIPILILSAQNDNSTQLEFIKLGAVDFISKPFSKQILFLKVRALLQNQEQYKEFLKNKIIDDSRSIVSEPSDNKFIQQVQSVVERLFNDPQFGVEQFAAEMGYSRSQLFRKMKATIDMSPVDYLKIYRLTKAKEIIESGTRRISETAYDVGFNDPMYFSNCFKSHFGHPPNYYLKK